MPLDPRRSWGHRALHRCPCYVITEVDCFGCFAQACRSYYHLQETFTAGMLSIASRSSVVDERAGDMAVYDNVGNRVVWHGTKSTLLAFHRSAAKAPLEAELRPSS